MSEVYKINEPGNAYFITFSVLNWFPVFEMEKCMLFLIDVIKFYQENRALELFGYCLMPTHVHLIARSESGDLAAIIRDLKRYSSRELTKIILEERKYDDWLAVMEEEANRIKRGGQYKFWQDGYHPMEIYSGWFFEQKLNYIHQNPVEDGLCDLPCQFKCSSARNYAGLESVLEIQTENGDFL